MSTDRSEASRHLESTRRSALYLWAGLSLALTLFFVQSQVVFIKGEALPTQRIEWALVLLGLVTFLFGFMFFRNYTRVRRQALLTMSWPERRQTLLVAYVLQFILFESLGLYGVLLSVLTQNTEKAVPFILFAYLGFYLAFPRRKQLEPFFQDK